MDYGKLSEKNKIMKEKYIFKAFVMSIIWSTLFSCTKTETIDYEKEPANKILEYKITNSQQTLLGAIDNETNTITVLIPYYLSIDYLVSEIELDEGAKLLDSLGTEINLENLEPVKLGETVKYIVKSSDGVQRTYTLVQKITPHPDPLAITISGIAEGITLIEKPVYGRFTILGNFESTSLNAKFYFTNKETGEVHTDYAYAASITPGAQYTMQMDISPDAKAGAYDVHMEHQGRSVDLPSLKLYYQRPWVPMFTSSASYAPGDTITFTVLRQVAANDSYATVFVGLKTLYMKIGANANNANLPANFPANLINTRIPMKIASANGAEVKAIFPDIPAGLYLGAYTSYGNAGLGTMYYLPPEYGICFYGDFDEQTNWGNDVFIASQIYSAGGFTVRAKE